MITSDTLAHRQLVCDIFKEINAFLEDKPCELTTKLDGFDSPDAPCEQLNDLNAYDNRRFLQQACCATTPKRRLFELLTSISPQRPRRQRKAVTPSTKPPTKKYIWMKI